MIDIKKELEHHAERTPQGRYRYSPDIRIAALAALVELKKVESFYVLDETLCKCPDSNTPHRHELDGSVITEKCCGSRNVS